MNLSSLRCYLLGVVTGLLLALAALGVRSVLDRIEIIENFDAAVYHAMSQR